MTSLESFLIPKQRKWGICSVIEWDQSLQVHITNKVRAKQSSGPEIYFLQFGEVSSPVNGFEKINSPNEDDSIAQMEKTKTQSKISFYAKGCLVIF